MEFHPKKDGNRSRQILPWWRKRRIGHSSYSQPISRLLIQFTYGEGGIFMQSR